MAHQKVFLACCIRHYVTPSLRCKDPDPERECESAPQGIALKRYCPHKIVHCAASKQEQQVKELGELLLRRRFLIKANRMFKKPKPGRKRLVKWPKKLVPTENPWVSLTEWALQ